MVPEKKDQSTKRLFNEKYSQTSISEVPEERSYKELTPSKRYFKQEALVYLDQNKSRERRHYEHSYTDKVDMSIKMKRKNSAYLNAKPDPPRN